MLDWWYLGVEFYWFMLRREDAETVNHRSFIWTSHANRAWLLSDKGLQSFQSTKKSSNKQIGVDAKAKHSIFLQYKVAWPVHSHHQQLHLDNTVTGTAALNQNEKDRTLKGLTVPRLEIMLMIIITKGQRGSWFKYTLNLPIRVVMIRLCGLLTDLR